MNPIRALATLVWGAVLAFGSGPARADYVHPTLAARAGTIVELRVNDGTATVLLEIDRKDRAFFSSLTGGSRPDGLRPFQLLDADSGRPLRPSVDAVALQPRTLRHDPAAPPPLDVRGQPLPLPELSELVTAVQLSYRLPNPGGGLVLVPPSGSEDGRAALAIGAIAFHADLPISSYAYLSRAETLELRPDDPWQSSFRNPNFRRAHASSASSYLTIEPFEVRHEIVVRLQDLFPALGLSLPGRAPISGTDRQRLIEAAAALFQQKAPIRIDGRRQTVRPEAIQFLTVDARGVFQQATDTTPLRPFSTLLGISLSFPVEELPQTVSLDWDLFSEALPSLAATVTDPAGPFPHQLTPDSPSLKWRNTLQGQASGRIRPVEVVGPLAGWRSPALVVGCLGAAALAWRHRRRWPALLLALAWIPLLLLQRSPALGATMLLSDQQATRLIEQLLRNVYRSMELRQESRVHDQLALSLSADLLSEVYVQQRRLLRSQQDGGATTRIRSVTLGGLEPRGGDRWAGEVSYRVNWLASGLVSHWGHTHQRRLRYDADVTLRAERGRWRLSRLTLLDEQRL